MTDHRKKPTTDKYSLKVYECRDCGTQETHGSNHWGDIYVACRKCHKNTSWKCCDPRPGTHDLPDPWVSVKLSDLGLDWSAKKHVQNPIRKEREGVVTKKAKVVKTVHTQGITINVVEHEGKVHGDACRCMVCPSCGATEVDDCRKPVPEWKWQIKPYRVDNKSHCLICDTWF